MNELAWYAIWGEQQNEEERNISEINQWIPIEHRIPENSLMVWRLLHHGRDMLF